MTHKDKRALRIIVCGGEHDGKSTLLDRMRLGSPSGEQRSQLTPDLKNAETCDANLGFAHAMDGLAAERAQDTDLDLAYRSFSTATRNFIVADVSSDERSLRNMVVGASAADLAIILVDAGKDGEFTQTRRLIYLAALMGIRHVVLAIDKLDIAGDSQAVFDRVDAEYRTFSEEIGLKDVVSIPMSLLTGDTIAEVGSNMSWYQGPGLMEYLVAVQVNDIALDSCPFRMQAQWVDAPGQDLRGYSGIVVGGTVKPGDRVRILPAGRGSTVARIVAETGELSQAVAGQSITVVLNDDANISGGTVLATADAPPGVSDQFEVAMVWLGEEPMMPGRNYLLKIGTESVTATFATPKYKIDVNTLDHIAAKKLEFSDIGVCNVSLDQQIVFDPYELNRDMGGFVLVDRISNHAVGVGMIHFALRRAENIHWQAIDINKNAHASLKGQKPCVLWFTGLSGSGKSTVANVVEKKLHAMGKHTYLLDGDNVRHGLNKDLGFTEADRVENIRRVGEVARLMVDAGLLVLVSFISPFRAERRMSRELVGPDEFYEIYVDTSIEVAEARDPKGLYKKARSGNLKNFTGIDSPYEVPESPEIRIDTTQLMPEQAAEIILSHLISSGNLGS